MTCQRCQGLMVEDYFLDLEESFIPCWFLGWRCVICGEVEDPLIRKHRILQTNQRHQPDQVPAGEKVLEEEGITLVGSHAQR